MAPSMLQILQYGLVITPLVVIVLLLLLKYCVLPRRVLLSLPYSHYVEIARWALEVPSSLSLSPSSSSSSSSSSELHNNNTNNGSHFVEVKVPVGPHVVVVGLYRVLFGGWSSTSSYPGSSVPRRKMDYGNDLLLACPPFLRRLASIPCFIESNGTCYPDSWSILQDYAGYTINPSLQTLFDEEFGPAVRQIGYYYLFAQKDLYRNIQSCSPLSMALFDLFEYTSHCSTNIMPQMMNVTAHGVAEAHTSVRNIFRHISNLLQESKNDNEEDVNKEDGEDPNEDGEDYSYLGDGCGNIHNTFGGADLSFCALAGWMLQPIPNYTNYQCTVPTPDLLFHQQPDFAALTHELRTTIAGKHVLKCYQQHRHTTHKKRSLSPSTSTMREQKNK